MQVAREPHLFTVADYMKLDIPGHTELLGGVIYDVSPQKPPHVLAVSRITRALNRGLGDEYRVNPQAPIAVQGWTGKYGPEVDVAVVAEKPYDTTPTDSDSFAFVEVSDTTYDEDRKYYIPLYVAAGVPTWHINIRERRVEFYPKGADPKTPTRMFTQHETFEILGVCISVADLFT